MIIWCKSLLQIHKYTKAVDKHSHYVQRVLVGVVLLSVFRGNFVLANLSPGLISVRCTELRGVRFLEVQNVLVI